MAIGYSAQTRHAEEKKTDKKKKVRDYEKCRYPNSNGYRLFFFNI